MTSLLDFVRSTPECEHHLLARKRIGDETGDDVLRHFHSFRHLPDSLLTATAAVRSAVRHQKPDVVHAHSSLAGVHVRLAPGVDAQKVVYTPHCYAFERRDVSWFARASFLVAESLLARRRHWVAAISPREALLSTRLGRGEQTMYVPNVARIACATAVLRDPFTVVTAGRVTPAKDPGWFAASARATRDADAASRWVWLGGGEDAACRRLRAAGVEVTGWLPRSQVLQRMSEASVYVHSAAWEGAPLTLLEAAAAGLPIAARRIPSLEALGVPSLHETPAELACAVLELRHPGRWQEAARASEVLRRRHSQSRQAAALRQMYAAASGRMSLRQLELPASITLPEQPSPNVGSAA